MCPRGSTSFLQSAAQGVKTQVRKNQMDLMQRLRARPAEELLFAIPGAHQLRPTQAGPFVPKDEFTVRESWTNRCLASDGKDFIKFSWSQVLAAITRRLFDRWTSRRITLKLSIITEEI